ncbi:MAG: nitroreductase family protein [Desulfobacterales bacterium]|jgi:nitroreductase/NAD-dependent dihydropyrimidine dehydrogenase PreA subunit|nr:nitroreductase family protein [Desulfobacterales bacterium]
MALLTINEKTCNKDGLCAAVCPMGIIEFSQGELPSPSVDAEDLCIGCGHCVAVCPTASMSHRKMAAQQCPPVQPELKLTPTHCEHFLRSRRSIRVYKDKPVPRNEMTRLIEMASHAPSGHNSQCPQWRVIDSPAQNKKLAQLVIDWMRGIIEKHSQMAADMQLPHVIRRWEAGTDVILRGAPVVVVAHADKTNRMAPAACTIALSYMELAAVSMGLGACWAGYFWAASLGFAPLAKALGLPEGHQCFGALMVGYPMVAYKRLPLRNPPVISWLNES